MMRYDGYGYGMMAFGFGWIMMIAIVAFIVLGIIVFIRYIRQSSNTVMRSFEDNALKILNERYAKGEISDEEYKSKKSNLKS